MDYPSALTGAQMDIALLDVAQHNSEAWAVGTRSGNAVTSGDEAFENNAKYYAELAQSVIPGTYTSAVRWDAAQALTDSQKAQARANIAAGASNRNLLDNPWWGSGEVVNQRSVTQQPSSNNQYTIDRWTWNTGASANTMSLGANGITFTRSASSIWFAQKMANPSALVGKTITGSVMLSDGTIKSGSVVYASVGSTPTLYEDSNIQIYISSVGAFSLTVKTTQTIRAVKLELGSYSTLINDVPPDYGEELAKCQYYFRRVSGDVYLCSGMAVSTTAVVFPFPFTMRANPTITMTGTISAVGSGGILAVSSVNSVGKASNAIQVRLTVSGATQYGAYLLTPQNGGYLDFSADL